MLTQLPVSPKPGFLKQPISGTALPSSLGELDSTAPRNVRVVIATHHDYHEKTMPDLLKSLVDMAHVPAEAILVVCGGEDNRRHECIEGVEWVFVAHNSFEYTALIEVIEGEHMAEEWYLLHDTCYVGPNFWHMVQALPRGFDYVSADQNAWTNIGLYRGDFLRKHFRYVLSLRNCAKWRAIYAERTFKYLGSWDTSDHSGLQELGKYRHYGDAVLRIVLYYADMDIYKLQASFNGSPNFLADAA